jgi:hypothetical protein
MTLVKLDVGFPNSDFYLFRTKLPCPISRQRVTFTMPRQQHCHLPALLPMSATFHDLVVFTLSSITSLTDLHSSQGYTDLQRFTSSHRASDANEVLGYILLPHRLQQGLLSTTFDEDTERRPTKGYSKRRQRGFWTPSSALTGYSKDFCRLPSTKTPSNADEVLGYILLPRSDTASDALPKATASDALPKATASHRAKSSRQTSHLSNQGNTGISIKGR